MSVSIAPDAIPLPPSPTPSSGSNILSSSFTSTGGTEDTEVSQAPPLPIATLPPILYTLATQNGALLSQLQSHHHSELSHIRSLTAEIKVHNDAIDARRQTSALLTQQREEYKTAERLFKDTKLNELTCRLLGAKNMSVGKDAGTWDRRARELEQLNELRDVIAELWIWDRTLLQGRMRELGEQDMSVEDGGGDLGARVNGIL